MHLNGKSRFTLELNTAKNTDCIKKCFKQKLYKIKFPTKTRVYVSPPGLELGVLKIFHFGNSVLARENMFTIELIIAKSNDYIKKCFNQNLSKAKFPTKILLSAYVYLP